MSYASQERHEKAIEDGEIVDPKEKQSDILYEEERDDPRDAEYLHSQEQSINAERDRRHLEHVRMLENLGINYLDTIR